MRTQISSLRRRFLAISAVVSLGILAAVGAVTPASATLPMQATSSELSESGTQAVADLRSCLASRDTLNVYYLVDSSLSLERADGAGAGTGSDPAFMRASVLANSLAQLGSIRAGITVNWGAGFFSTEYENAIDWRTWQSESPAQLKRVIEAKEPGGYTNWISALLGAQRQLADQQSRTPGCQILVWLTDGQIDMQAPDGQQQEDLDALNQLCGAPIRPNGKAPSGNGVFDALRQSGVVVFGALLTVDSASAGAAIDMQSLVEGSAPEGKTACGVSPVPDGYAHGAFLKATGPDSLARVFLELSAQVTGGFPRPFDADGSFWIDEGVARFRIILAGSWSLLPPDSLFSGSVSATSKLDWLTVSQSDGATVIDVDTRAPETAGKWQLTANDTRSLFLFSDLRIQFEDKGSVEVGTDGSTVATLQAQVVDAENQPFPTNVYGHHEFNAWYLDADGKRAPLSNAELDTETGAISIPLPENLTLAQLVVSASLDPLTTRDHNLSLAPVTTEQTVTTVLPAQFPRIAEQPVRLSTLEGSHGAAEGTIVITGPSTGGTAQVCVADAPNVLSDAGQRDGWTWKIGADLTVDACVEVAEGETAQLPLSVTNSTAADSAVVASVPLTFVSGSGDEIRQDLRIEFRSTHPINALAAFGWFFGLLLLGFAIAWALAHVMKVWSTRLGLRTETQRASFSALVSNSGLRVNKPADSGGIASAFSYVAVPEKGLRSYPSDSELGVVRARYGLTPLSQPTFEIHPPAGSRIAYIQQGKDELKVDPGSARVKLRSLSFDHFAAVIISEHAVQGQDGEAAPATVVIYHRAVDSNDSLAVRFEELDQRSADIADAVDRLRSRLADDARAARLAKAPRTKDASSAPTIPSVPDLGGYDDSRTSGPPPLTGPLPTNSSRGGRAPDLGRRAPDLGGRGTTSAPPPSQAPRSSGSTPPPPLP